MRTFSQSRIAKGVSLSLMSSLAFLSFLSPIAIAQEVAAVDQIENGQANSSEIEQIIVTGSRLRNDGSNEATPVTMISSKDLEMSAELNVADYINKLPQLQNSSTPRSVGFTSSNDFQGANQLNLRNLGSERTLVLLDGRRVVPSVSNGAVDLNLIPNALVKRIDIVTGGASAAYGADAVAGVVNLVLDTKYEGVKAHIQGGSSSEGDAESVSGSIAGGTSFADGRGHFIASFDYADNKPASLGDRDWARGTGIIPNPNYVLGNGESESIITNIGSGLATPGGLFIPPPLRGTQFDDNGNPIPFDFGPPSGNSFNSASSDAYDVIPLQQLTTAVERNTAFARFSYDVQDNLSIYGEVLYAKSENRQETLPLFRFVNILIKDDNAYLDPATAQRLNDAGVAATPMSKFALNLGVLEPSNEREVQRYLLGIDGTFGSEDWAWGAYYQYGEVETTIRVDNNAITANFNKSADAVLDGSGNIVCRSTLTDPSNGCLPYNSFGNQPVDQAVKNYITGSSLQNQRFTQHVWSVSASGTMADLWAGPLMVAVGADYRRESANADADELSRDNQWFVGNYEPFGGELDVKEAFVEIGMPILDDTDYGTLDFNAAFRMTNYSNSGSVNTWKGGMVYSPTQELRFRITRSSDIRAPNTNELFSQGRFNTTAVNDPFNNGASDGVLQRRAGNINLTPEEADTLTIGGVYQPEWLPGLSLSIDYFDIKLEGEITGTSIQRIVDDCFAGDDEACGFVLRDNTGDIIQIDNVPFNLSESRVAGVDFEIYYTTKLGAGDLSVRSFASYVDKLSQGKPGSDNFVSRRGEVGNNAGVADAGSPTWTSITNIGYLTDSGTTFGGSLRYIHSALIESDFSSIELAENDIPARTYLDLNISHAFETDSATYQVFANIDNVFDKDPPIVPSLQGTAAFDTPTNSGLYDTLGRMYRVGVRVKF